MAKTGYVVFVLELTPRNKPDDLRSVAAFGGADGDLLGSLVRLAIGKRGALERLDRFETAFRIDSVIGRSRWLGIEAKFGPYGTNGFLIHVDGATADSQFGERQARAVNFRAMFVVPDDGTTALVFCERLGATHLKAPIEQVLLREAVRELGGVARLSAHVDHEAWDRFLADGQASEVTEVWRSTREEDYIPDRGNLGTLKVSLTGGAALRRGRAIQSALRRRIAGAPPSQIQVSISEVSVGEGFVEESSTIRIADGEEQRTVTIERGEFPQWVYQIERATPTATLMSAWAQHARTILSERGVTMEDGWETAPPWPASFHPSGD